MLAATLSHVEFQAQRGVPKEEFGIPKYGQLAPPAPLAAGNIHRFTGLKTGYGELKQGCLGK